MEYAYALSKHGHVTIVYRSKHRPLIPMTWKAGGRRAGNAL